MLLAIDTATLRASIAVFDLERDQLLCEVSWAAGRQAITQLVQTIEMSLHLGGIDRSALSAVGVSTGPGSFNGVRIGVTSAKAIAWSLQIPIVGVNTLEVAAFQYRQLSLISALGILPILDAGRAEIAIAIYRLNRQGWTEELAPTITRADLLHDQLAGKQLIACGEIAKPVEVELRAAGIAQIERCDHFRRAGSLAILAAQRLRDGHVDSAESLVPLYLQRPPINPGNPAAR